MSDHRVGEARTKRAKRQPTVGWLIRQLMKHPPGALVVVPGQGMAQGMPKNMTNVTQLLEVLDKDFADYKFQYVDGRRPGRKMVQIW